MLSPLQEESLTESADGSIYEHACPNIRAPKRSSDSEVNEHNFPWDALSLDWEVFRCDRLCA